MNDSRPHHTQEVRQRSPRAAWSTSALILAVALAFVAGTVISPTFGVRADVTKGEPRETFKDGGVLANETLKESLAVLKRLDQRVERIEKALLEVVK